MFFFHSCRLRRRSTTSSTPCCTWCLFTFSGKEVGVDLVVSLYTDISSYDEIPFTCQAVVVWGAALSFSNTPIAARYIMPSILSTICCKDLHDTYSKCEHAWSRKRAVCSVFIPKVFQRAKDFFCMSGEGSQCSCGFKYSLLNLLCNQQHIKLCSISPFSLKFKPLGRVCMTQILQLGRSLTVSPPRNSCQVALTVVQG